MDDRKKQINELEQRKKEQAAVLDSLLTDFGETLFGRIDPASPEDFGAFGELVAYRRCKDDIAASEISIQAVEEQIRRFRELEDGIEEGEQDEGDRIKELSALYTDLGKMLLDASADYAEFCAPWREQAEALQTKIDSLDDRIDGLEQQERGNVFTWIGKGAQGLVLRSFLTRALENLEQLQRYVGERYSERSTGRLIDDGERDSIAYEDGQIEELCREIETRRAELREFSQNLESIREEKKVISGSFSAEGGPLKHIQSLKNYIAHSQDELKSLYKRIGAEAIFTGAAERRECIVALVRQEDGEILDNAARIDKSIHEAETAIEKLRASLAIDDEKAKIEKYRRMINDRKDRIAQAEKNIAEFEEGIRDSESSIERLKDLL